MRLGLPNQPAVALLATISLLLTSSPLFSGQVLVAAASNFAPTIRQLAQRYQQKTGHRVILSFGSTGKLFAQISHGAPFDLFLAADKDRPLKLDQQRKIVPAGRFTYAIGKLVLWSPSSDFVDNQGRILAKDSYRHLAIANPELAPYGKAAKEVLQHAKLWQSVQSRLVRGENIGQAFHFVKSGNAELGFIAYSQILTPAKTVAGSWWDIPQTLYSAIEQQAVILQDNEAARDFADFIQSPEAKAMIRDHGYRTE